MAAVTHLGDEQSLAGSSVGSGRGIVGAVGKRDHERSDNNGMSCQKGELSGGVMRW